MPLQLKPRSSPARPPFTFSPPKSNHVELEPPKSPPEPPAELLPERDMHMFGTYPLRGAGEVGRGLVKCLRCGKVVMEWAFADHKRNCARFLDGAPPAHKKTAKVERKDEGVKKRRASEDSGSTIDSTDKKRARLLLDNEMGHVHSYKGLKKGDIKKIQKERVRLEKREAKEREKHEIAERKRQRASCPINFDRQCGVINDKGLPCSRSLTCKTHTVGAKRGVEGRSRSYDLLYLEWQRANNPNFKEPASKKDKEPHRPVVPGSGTTLTKKKSTTRRDIDEETLAMDKGGLEELIHCARMAGERLCRPGLGGSGMVGGGEKGEKGSVWRVASYEFALVGDMLTKALAARPKAQPGAAASTKVGAGAGVKALGTAMGMGTGMGMGMGLGMGAGAGAGPVPMMGMGGGYGDGLLSGRVFPVPA